MPLNELRRGSATTAAARNNHSAHHYSAMLDALEEDPGVNTRSLAMRLGDLKAILREQKPEETSGSVSGEPAQTIAKLYKEDLHVSELSRTEQIEAGYRPQAVRIAH
ncbi:hypothetical protein RB195_016680 [Necator americanus]|uniref:Uncharacterized protein n=1 Tax=Necator americanus TaxID=51031 RepID=A0ABR1C469_NECAM